MNLTNKRILITRPRAQAEEFASTLMAAGAHPIFFPVIQIVPLNDFSDLDSWSFSAHIIFHHYNFSTLSVILT